MLIERTRLSNVDANVLTATGGAPQMPLNVSVGSAPVAQTVQSQVPSQTAPGMTLDALSQPAQAATEAQPAVTAAQAAAMPVEAPAAAQAATEARPAATTPQAATAPTQPSEAATAPAQPVATTPQPEPVVAQSAAAQSAPVAAQPAAVAAQPAALATATPAAPTAPAAPAPLATPASPQPAPSPQPPRPVALTGPEAANMGSPDPDPAATAAAERLSTSRLGYRVFKRAFDIVFSAAVLVCLSWLYVLVAIAIKVDDPAGPVFFTQERVGRDGKRFRMWKFRSMCADAESKLADLQAQNEKDGPVFKIAEDPRITRVGHFIRKTSIDELPQFFNVLLGHISIVGPRPALPREVALYTPRQRQRLLVKPGITCYWQTRRNRDAISFDEWVELDLLYIKQCSTWADFKLIVQTVGVVLTAQGS